MIEWMAQKNGLWLHFGISAIAFIGAGGSPRGLDDYSLWKSSAKGADKY